MRLLLVGMNYAPEITGIGPYNSGLCEYMSALGHQVTAIVPFPHYPQWNIFAGYRNGLVMEEQINGVRVIRIHIHLPNGNSASQRVLYDLSLCVNSLLAGLILAGRQDITICVSPPLLAGITSWLLSRSKRSRFVFHLQDLHPDGLVEIGKVRNSALIQGLYGVERFVYRRADAISVIGVGFAERLLEKGVPVDKVRVLPNWIDVNFVKPLSKDNQFRRSLGLTSEDFVIMHVGNMGFKQGLENVLHAANLLREHQDIVFVLVGDGVEGPKIRYLTRELGLPNVRILDVQPRELLPSMLAAADLLLLNQRAAVVNLVIPVKLVTYSASGRPVLAAAHPESQAARFVREAECGHVVEPDNPSALAEGILHLRNAPDLCQYLGEKARSFAERHYAEEKVLQAFAAFLDSVVDTT